MGILQASFAPSGINPFRKRKNPVITLALLGLLLCVSFYLRWISAVETSVNVPLRADAGDYFMYAYNLKHKHTYSRDQTSLRNKESPVKPDAVRSPGYPLFLALFVNGLPTGAMLQHIVLFQAVLSSLTVCASFFLFLAFLDRPLAGIAAFLTALSPHLIVANSYLLTETLFCFLLVATLYSARSLPSRPSLGFAFFSGLLLGFGSLVRPILQYFPVLFSIFLVFHFGWRKGSKLAGLSLLGFILSFSPWIARNLQTLGIPADKTLMINFLHHGMYPNFTYANIKESRGYPYLYDPKSSEIGADIPTVLGEISRRFQEDPGMHLSWYLLGKPVAFWSWNTVQGEGDAFIYPVHHSPYFRNPVFQASHRIMTACHWPVILLALLGCILSWFSLGRVGMERDFLFVPGLLSVLLLYFTLIHIVGAPFPRYSFPLRPLLYGLALFPVQVLQASLRKFYFAGPRDNA
jgi:hypothetical protein